MSLAIVHSRALSGVSAPPVVVEVHIGNGLPAFNLVGLPDTEVRESRERVRAALQTSGFDFPSRKVTVNLAPADLPKDSGRFDLPIALGVLAASGQLAPARLPEHELVGELALDGALRPVRGALAMALSVRRDGRAFVVPEGSAEEAALVDGATVLAARTLEEVWSHLSGRSSLPEVRVTPSRAEDAGLDLADVRGQHAARRALEVAAAGGHSLLMVGPPGTGKSMLAARLPGLLPALGDAEALEVAAVHSLAGRFSAAQWGRRPFRHPHHSASAAAIVGGGAVPRPGEISLAHRGVLFLDELPEFDRRVLEALREPLEAGTVQISRAGRQAQFPARFQLVAAMNPCPCGYLGHASGRCRCTSEQIARYRARLSGPLLDRIDLHVEVPALPLARLREGPGESSAVVRERVVAAHARQHARQGKLNAALEGPELERFCATEAGADRLLVAAVERLTLSARACHRVLRVARTIADLDGAGRIGERHLAQALQHRAPTA